MSPRVVLALRPRDPGYHRDYCCLMPSNAAALFDLSSSRHMTTACVDNSVRMLIEKLLIPLGQMLVGLLSESQYDRVLGQLVNPITIFVLLVGQVRAKNGSCCLTMLFFLHICDSVEAASFNGFILQVRLMMIHAWGRGGGHHHQAKCARCMRWCTFSACYAYR